MMFDQNFLIINPGHFYSIYTECEITDLVFISGVGDLGGGLRCWFGFWLGDAPGLGILVGCSC
jgi:hypothetical protein